MAKKKYKTTKEERDIIDTLDCDQIEVWAEQRQFWRIFKAVIKATREHLEEKR